jgi:hypothetical protein
MDAGGKVDIYLVQNEGEETAWVQEVVWATGRVEFESLRFRFLLPVHIEN